MAVCAVLAEAEASDRDRVRTKKKHKHVQNARATRRGDFDLNAFAGILSNLGMPFESYFRLPRGLFDDLVARLRPHPTTNPDSTSRNSCGHVITPEQRVAVALRWMAGAQWQDVVIGMQPISRASAYASLWLVVDAINVEYAGKWDYPRPKPGASKEEWAEANVMYAKREQRFRQKSPQECMVGAIGAIDGCILRTTSPGLAVENPADYMCARKHMFGLLLMAASDADMVIRYWSIKHTPKTHDSEAWGRCELGAWVASGNLPQPYCFLGDNAFR